MLEKEGSDNQFKLFWREINEKIKNMCIDDPIVEKKTTKRLQNVHGYFTSEGHPQRL